MGIEFATFEAAQRAGASSKGISSLPYWEAAKVPAPKVVLVSRDLFERLRSGTVPWPDGGPCSDDLRTILARQFDQSHVSVTRNRSPPRQQRRSSPPRRTGSSTLAESRRGSSPDRPRPEIHDDRDPRRSSGAAGGGWEEKLKALKMNVNNGASTTKRLRY